MGRQLKSASDLATKAQKESERDQVLNVPVIATDIGQIHDGKGYAIVRAGHLFEYSGYLSKDGELPLWMEPSKPEGFNIEDYIVKKLKENKKSEDGEKAAPAKKAAVKAPAAPVLPSLT